MHRKLRLLVYGAAGAALIIAALAAPAAWATPGQNVLAQTIPTKTPASRPAQPTVPPAAPTTAPQPTAEPGVTPVATPDAQTTCSSTASLTLVSDRQAVWPGATVTFTATLTNTGKQPLHQLVLENVLPQGLEPVSVISGEGQFAGNTLRLTSPELNPSASLTAVYSARVQAGAASKPLSVGANATVAGCPRKTAVVTLGPPPSELPVTGGSLQ